MGKLATLAVDDDAAFLAAVIRDLRAQCGGADLVVKTDSGTEPLEALRSRADVESLFCSVEELSGDRARSQHYLRQCGRQARGRHHSGIRTAPYGFQVGLPAELNQAELEAVDGDTV